MAIAAVGAVGALVLLAGCFSEILPAGPATKLQFICAVLDPDQAERVVVESWDGEGPTVDTAPALLALQAELAHLSARQGDVSIRHHDGPDAPRGGWNETNLRAWLDDRPGTLADEVRLHVVWVRTLGGASVMQPAPGLVAVAEDTVQAGAAHMGRPAADVARAELLHVAGHALGAVNLGLPVQDPDLQERERPAGHDPDPASVLNAGWEDAATMAWAANATYDAWPPALHADWAAAVQPGGVCAP